MRSPRRHILTPNAIMRATLGLMVITLLIGCDGSTPPVPTPVAIQSPPPPTLSPDPAGTASPSAVAGSSPTAGPLLPGTISPGPTVPAITAWAPTIPWRGADRYLLGANYPYHRYGNDFGGNAWGSYGVHDPSTYAVVDADFAKMSSLGIRTVRWFAFADGRAGITFDQAGLPSGIDEYVLRDFDAALEIALRHNIGINFALLDFRFAWDAKTENGVQLGGHSAVLASPEGQQALVRNVFEPVFKRYAGHPAILSWEVMNEPEWTLQDAGHINRSEVSQPLKLATFRAFAKLTIDAIHNVARSYATIGCADMKWAQNWVGLGLDYYQIHYYDWMQPYSTDNLYAVRADALRLDRPVVVGEFPANVSAVATLREYLDTWYANGYAGAWPWAFRADAMWGTPDPATFQSWAEANKPVVDIPAPEGAPTAEVLSYTVEEGDTLTWIAARFDTTTEALIEVNSLPSTVIQPGQVLVIPRRSVTRETATPTAP